MSENVTLWFHLHNILEKAKYIEIVKGSVIFWGIEEGHGGGINKWSTKGFEGCKTILCVTVIVSSWHYTFVKSHRTVQYKEGTVM